MWIFKKDPRRKPIGLWRRFLVNNGLIFVRSRNWSGEKQHMLRLPFIKRYKEVPDILCYHGAYSKYALATIGAATMEEFAKQHGGIEAKKIVKIAESGVASDVQKEMSKYVQEAE